MYQDVNPFNQCQVNFSSAEINIQINVKWELYRGLQEVLSRKERDARELTERGKEKKPLTDKALEIKVTRKIRLENDEKNKKITKLQQNKEKELKYAVKNEKFLTICVEN